MNDVETYPKNIKSLLFRGFLAHRMKIGGLQVTFKTLSENERELIEFLQPVPARRFLFDVVHSIFMIDEVNLLEERSRTSKFGKLVKAFTSLDKEVLSRISEEMRKLATWYFYEVRNIFRYSLESESRTIWPSYRIKALNDPGMTGILGTDRVGLNLHQVHWRVHNELEDKNIEQKSHWSVAKFLAAAWVGSREIQKVENREKLVEEETDRIKKRILDGETDFNRGHQLEETVQELERQIKGQKDEFDLFVEKEECKQKTEKVSRILRDQIFSNELFKHRKDEIYVIGDDEFVEKDEMDLVVKALSAVNKGSLRAELKLSEEEKVKLIEKIRSEVLVEIERTYGNVISKA